jgi:hypothetical protein
MLAFYIITSSTKVDNMQVLGRYNNEWVCGFFFKVKVLTRGSRCLIKK